MLLRFCCLFFFFPLGSRHREVWEQLSGASPPRSRRKKKANKGRLIDRACSRPLLAGAAAVTPHRRTKLFLVAFCQSFQLSFVFVVVVVAVPRFLCRRPKFSRSSRVCVCACVCCVGRGVRGRWSTSERRTKNWVSGRGASCTRATTRSAAGSSL
ncbi:uncharacterized protein Tco025E_00106 [Trypanosoma conorhini]|uniref:Secreted protein n=1 Tax=Trypanosoma conorhini TaxID=83891 RepID=A0A3R7NVG2_9TRYP|nr:uncharacterized protein Tco025E_00106 [Trypanosoma conorhini]RNF27722.1 hypothetical protein Tco025E_00106 [Trypanosoma conorhini]